MDETKLRFSSAEWADFKDAIDLIGVGGIGSWTALLLSKIGYNITIWDDDVVEPVNIGGQYYSTANSSSNNPKVYALKDLLRSLGCNNVINTKSERFTHNTFVEPYSVTIMALDNMTSRKEIAEMWHKHRINTPGCILFDARMEAEQIDIFCITNEEQYKKYMSDHMFNDDEVAEAPCSFKATPQTGMLIASKIVSFLVNHIYNQKVGENIRVIPFHYREITPAVFNEVEI